MIPSQPQVWKKEDCFKILAYEAESTRSLKTAIESRALENYQNISLWVGPEGGFSEKEVDAATDSEISIVSLGDLILRTETAGMFMLSVIKYHLEL